MVNVPMNGYGVWFGLVWAGLGWAELAGLGYAELGWAWLGLAKLGWDRLGWAELHATRNVELQKYELLNVVAGKWARRALIWEVGSASPPWEVGSPSPPCKLSHTKRQIATM